MRPPVSPLSTTTTRRTSCTLATRIPPNYEPGSRFRVLAPDGSEVDVTVPAGAEAGDMIQVPLTVTDQPNWAPVGGSAQVNFAALLRRHDHHAIDASRLTG